MPPTDANVEETEEVEEVVVDDAREALVAAFRSELGDAIVEHHIAPGHDAWLRVTAASWFEVISTARGEFHMNYLDFLAGMDWLPSPYGRSEDSGLDEVIDDADDPQEMTWGYAGGETRFQVFARLCSIRENNSVTIKVDVPDLVLDSIVDVYAGAEWHERETYEMFGIRFDGHPGLRPLYLPTDFEGHPLRKDFPLLARHIKPWPGLVDVEPMPGEGDDEAAAEGEG